MTQEKPFTYPLGESIWLFLISRAYPFKRATSEYKQHNLFDMLFLKHKSLKTGLCNRKYYNIIVQMLSNKYMFVTLYVQKKQ